jgi:hypothetical protein
MDVPTFTFTMAKTDDVEIRFMAPRRLAEVADAIAIAHRKNRGEVLLEVIEAWANQQVHVATLIHRVTRGTPGGSDPGRSGTE